MKKLTFCVFSANDEPLEQERVKLCLNSLLSQDTDESCILFFDCSKPGKGFDTPDNPDLRIIQRRTENEKGWSRSVIRNEMALMVQTPIMCQICSDCAYSPNFARKLIEIMGDGNKLIMCRRRSSSEKQFAEIRKNGKVTPEMAKSIELYTPAACGECQCMMTSQFIGRGGYHQLIKNGRSTVGKFSETAAKDDTDLKNYVIKDRQYVNETHNIKAVWIHDELNIWMVHLFHEERENAKYWNNNR